MPPRAFLSDLVSIGSAASSTASSSPWAGSRLPQSSSSFEAGSEATRFRPLPRSVSSSSRFSFCFSFCFFLFLLFLRLPSPIMLRFAAYRSGSLLTTNWTRIFGNRFEKEPRTGTRVPIRGSKGGVANSVTMNHIPDDVAFSILSRLPLKSLKRFTCVGKSWILLFQNPHFMSMFGKHFISTQHSSYDDTCLLLKQIVPSPGYYSHHCVLYLLDGERFENKVKLEWPLPFQEEEWPLDILGSCINGILCLYDVHHERGLLWNPATEEFKHIPPSPSQVIPYNTAAVFTIHGFGYDDVRDDYKVIRRLHFNQHFSGVKVDSAYIPKRPGPFWEIYSLRSNYWRKLNENMPSIAGPGVYLNGVCHWLGRYNMIDGEKLLVSFNMSSEMFFTTPLLLDDMHDSFDSKLVKRQLVVLNGSIAMISKYTKTASFNISILGELGVKESWAKLFIVGPLPRIKRPIGVGKKGDIFFRTKDGELVCFDLNTQTIEEIGVKGVLGCQVEIYKKNLFPIGGINN